MKGANDSVSFQRAIHSVGRSVLAVLRGPFVIIKGIPYTPDLNLMIHSNLQGENLPIIQCIATHTPGNTITLTKHNCKLCHNRKQWSNKNIRLSIENIQYLFSIICGLVKVGMFTGCGLFYFVWLLWCRKTNITCIFPAASSL